MEMAGASTPVRTQPKVQNVAAMHSTRCTQMGGAALVSGGGLLQPVHPCP